MQEEVYTHFSEGVTTHAPEGVNWNHLLINVNRETFFDLMLSIIMFYGHFLIPHSWFETCL